MEITSEFFPLEIISAIFVLYFILVLYVLDPFVRNFIFPHPLTRHHNNFLCH